MKLPFRKSLAGRFLLATGFATVLPLVLLVAVVLSQGYDATSRQTFMTIEQTSRRYAAEFSSRLNEKLGMLKAVAAVLDLDTDPVLARRLLAADPHLKAAWIRREGTTPDYHPPHREALYAEVVARKAEVLSDPDFARNEASLGLPLFENGRFAGMVAVSFSLQYFQDVVDGVRVFDTGYALLVSHHGSRIAHPDRRLIGVRIGNDVNQATATGLLARVEAGRDFSFEKSAILTGKWSRQYYSAVTVGRSENPWFFVIVVPTLEATQDLDAVFLVLILGVLGTLALVAGATFWTTRSVVRPLRNLAASAEAIADGRWETRVPWTSRDELGILAHSFNHMTDQLVRALQDREGEVRERTASLEKSLSDLEEAQGKLVASERMAVLGQLTGTIAHEINTPLGAIRSSASFLLERATARASNLPEFYRSLDEESLALYRELLRGKEVNLTPVGVEVRKRRRALAQVLGDMGVTQASDLAEDIVYLVPPQREDELVQEVARGQAPVIHQAAQAAAFVQAGAIILEAADRAAATVANLVRYARGEEREALQDPGKASPPRSPR